MRNHRTAYLYILILILFTSVKLEAGDNTIAASFLQDSSILGNAEHTIMTTELLIETPRGEKKRELKIYKEELSNNHFKLMAQVVYPPFLNSMKLLVIKNAQHVSRWIKTSRGVRTVVPTSRKERLFDSDLDTEDLIDMDISLYQLRIADENENSIVIEAVQKNNSGKRLVTIDKKMQLIMSVDYYDSQDQFYKQYKVMETIIERETAFPKICIIEHPKESTRTVLRFTAIEMPSDISSRYFNQYQL